MRVIAFIEDEDVINKDPQASWTTGGKAPTSTQGKWATKKNSNTISTIPHPSCPCVPTCGGSGYGLISSSYPSHCVLETRWVLLHLFYFRHGYDVSW